MSAGTEEKPSNIAGERLRSIVERIERPVGIRAGKKPAERFLSKVRIASSGCIEWTGSLSPQGYGWFYWMSKSVLAHRWIYEAAHGSIAPGLVIDHLCRNRCCVNIAHLECVSMGENTKRGILHDVQRAKAKQKTHCLRGHPLFGSNLKTSPEGHRMCKTCQRDKADKWRASHRDRVNYMQQLRRAKAA